VNYRSFFLAKLLVSPLGNGKTSPKYLGKSWKFGAKESLHRPRVLQTNNISWKRCTKISPT